MGLRSRITSTIVLVLVLIFTTFIVHADWNPPPNQPECPRCNPHVYGTPPGASPDRFTPIALAAGFEPYGEGTAAPAFWKDPWGMVHLRGIARYVGTEPGFNGATFHVGTLPPGHQVAEKEWFPTVHNGIIELTADGRIYLHFGFPEQVSLSGITFYAP